MGTPIEGYGVATEGPVSKDSPLHDLYLIQTLPDTFITTAPDRRRLFDELFRDSDEMRDYPWFDPLRVLQFMTLVDIANRLPGGDCAEVGTAAGNAARHIFRLMDPRSHLYCFDTFEGFDEQEVERENAVFQQDVNKAQIGSYRLSDVRRRITSGAEASNLTLVKGWFPGTFRGYEHLRFRFVHLDVDLYEPTRNALELLWPRLLPGGVMVFHDYGCSLFPGVRKAVDEFLDPLGLAAIPLFDKLVSAAVVKPRPPRARLARMARRVMASFRLAGADATR